MGGLVRYGLGGNGGDDLGVCVLRDERSGVRRVAYDLQVDDDRTGVVPVRRDREARRDVVEHVHQDDVSPMRVVPRRIWNVVWSWGTIGHLL